MRVILFFLVVAASLPCIFGATVQLYNQLGCNPANSTMTTIQLNGVQNGCTNRDGISYSMFCVNQVSAAFTKFKVPNCPAENDKIESTFLVNDANKNAIGNTCEESFLWELLNRQPFSAKLNCTGSWVSPNSASSSNANGFGIIAFAMAAAVAALVMA